VRSRCRSSMWWPTASRFSDLLSEGAKTWLKRLRSPQMAGSKPISSFNDFQRSTISSNVSNVAMFPHRLFWTSKGPEQKIIPISPRTNSLRHARSSSRQFRLSCNQRPTAKPFAKRFHSLVAKNSADCLQMPFGTCIELLRTSISKVEDSFRKRYRIPSRDFMQSTRNRRWSADEDPRPAHRMLGAIGSRTSPINREIWTRQ